MSWLSVNDFKDVTGMTLPDIQIQEALNSASREIIRKIFITKRYQAYDLTSKHQLVYPIADLNTDGVVDVDDVTAWQEDKTTLEETSLSSHIVSVANGHQRAFIEFDASYPEANKTLFVEYKVSKNDIPLMIDELKELEKHLAVIYLFTNTPYSQLQSGISSWTLNGVSISFDQNAMISAKEEAMKQVKRLMQALRPIRADGLALGMQYQNRIAASKYAGNRFIW